MKCTRCGNELPEGADVCGFCGAVIKYGDMSQEQQYTQRQQYYNQQQQQYYNKPQNNQQYNNYQYLNSNQYGNPYGQIHSNSILKKINVLAIICAVILAIATMLPFGTASFWGMKSEYSLMDGSDGWFFIVVALITLGFALKNVNIGIIVIGVIGLFLMYIELTSFADNVASSEYGSIIQKGAGYYLLVLGMVGVLVSGIVKLVLDKREERTMYY
jgi:hypothetical protein